jgi:hypothetical protein
MRMRGSNRSIIEGQADGPTLDVPPSNPHKGSSTLSGFDPLFFAARFPTEATSSTTRGPGRREPLVSFGLTHRSIKMGPVFERHRIAFWPRA